MNFGHRRVLCISGVSFLSILVCFLNFYFGNLFSIRVLKFGLKYSRLEGSSVAEAGPSDSSAR